MRPWARFLRFGHLLWHVPGMFQGDVHRAVTWRGGILGYKTLLVECDCGRTW